MFLELDSVTGESKDNTYKDKIDILAWSWGMSQSGTTHMGSGGGAGKVNVQDLSVTKYVDNASGTLMLKCCKGTHIATGKLVVRKAGDNPVEYIVIELKEILVSSISTGGSGGEDRLTENIVLNFAKFHFKYKKQADDGTASDGPECSWDIPGNVSA
jgi:type VI secretion system secreted protein Hcp